VTASTTSAPYAGTGPFPAASAPVRTRPQRTAQVTVTGLIVVVPFAGLIAAIWLLWGRGVGVADLGLAVLFYLVTGFGVTLGFHRCLTHRSFTARPALRVALAIAGSMAFQGDVIGWVATHRRHHAFTDRPGDPHSPYRYGIGLAGQLRGLLHAHVGWLFGNDPTPQQRYAPDMLACRSMRRVSRAFPALCAVSLALPFAAGVGAWRHLAGWAAGAGVGRARSRFPAAARHLECELPVPPARQPALYHPPPRPGHQFVAAGGAVVGGELAQHAPLGSELRPARRRPRPDRSVSRIDPRVRTPRVGYRRAVAHPCPA
jgi:hypothetical protein